MQSNPQAESLVDGTPHKPRAVRAWLSQSHLHKGRAEVQSPEPTDQTYQKFSLTRASLVGSSDTAGVSKAQLVLPRARIGTDMGWTSGSHRTKHRPIGEALKQTLRTEYEPLGSRESVQTRSTAAFLQTKQLWSLHSPQNQNSHALLSHHLGSSRTETTATPGVFRHPRVKIGRADELQERVKGLESELDHFKLKYYQTASRLGDSVMSGAASPKPGESLSRIFRQGYLGLDQQQPTQADPEHLPDVRVQINNPQTVSMEAFRLLQRHNAELVKENKSLKALLASSRYVSLEDVGSWKTKKIGGDVLSAEVSADPTDGISRDISGHFGPKLTSSSGFLQVSKIQAHVIDFSAQQPISSDRSQTLASLCRDYARMVAKSSNSPFVVMAFHDAEVVELFCDLYPK